MTGKKLDQLDIGSPSDLCPPVCFVFFFKKGPDLSMFVFSCEKKIEAFF